MAASGNGLAAGMDSLDYCLKFPAVSEGKGFVI